MAAETGVGYPVLLRPSFTLGGSGAAIVWNAEEFDTKVALGPAAEPARRGAGRAVGARLEGIRARGDARQQRQRRHHLLDRELRSDGRAHRRLDHHRAGDDADRQGVPDHARRGAGRDPRDRRRDRRLEHPVRGQPGERPDDRHRDEPARVAQLGAGVEGDRVPDRQDRHQAGDRLHARRGPQRHHARDAGLLRADHRLRRHQGAALRVREVPGRRRRARPADEVGRRGDGDRPHLQGEPGQGAPLAGDRPLRASTSTTRRRSTSCKRQIVRPGPDRLWQLAEAMRAGLERRRRRSQLTKIDPWFLRNLRQMVDADEAVRVDGAQARRADAGRRRRRCCGASSSACPTGAS